MEGVCMATFQIKKEELDIAKKWLQTGEVNIYRETFTEEKTFTVPVKREELVIKKKVLASSDSEIKNMPTEIIRIPLSEEHVEFTKHKVNLEEVSIYKQQIQDIKHIEETLKREALKVKISDSLKFLDNSNSKYS
ncbi:YsnF/AvaK domain-containing protein [Clostridium estertheticum]|nr:YsnF/AvaK domain-containing protein [Clostridium estertheticum]WLC81341.1 YsnF/AvaK domain-containing protein [Clostridium estertheticum]